MNYIRTMEVFAVLVALASTGSNSASELEQQYRDHYEEKYKDQHENKCEDQYYVDLNFETQWGESFQLKPSIVMKF